MHTLLKAIIQSPGLHSQWLNTLSMMENTGARKIKNCEDPVFVNEIILKHAAEEARHAYYLKKQIRKIDTDACPTYEHRYLLAPYQSFHYLHALDLHICRFLKNEFGYSGSKLKYAAYLLVTYAIEVRADELYPVYQEVLSEAGSAVNVKSIIAEEKNHLEEMITQLKTFSGDWERLCEIATQMEETLFRQWLKDLQKVVNTSERDPAIIPLYN